MERAVLMWAVLMWGTAGLMLMRAGLMWRGRG